MKTARKYPIGIQSFESLISDDYLYVDKTDLVYQLVKSGKIFFLSRPRRFGKSLLTSTLEAYFLGKKQLFKGLALENLEKEWIEYPVLHIDLSGENYAETRFLEANLNDVLCQWERIYGTEPSETTLPLRFKGIIRRAYEQTGKGVVVLIDEYDKPMLEAIGNEKLSEDFRNILRGFYGVLKPSDEYLKFTFLTGVTKFGQMSVFSELNQPKDISMSEKYDTLCGITEEEMLHYFDDEIHEMAEKFKMTYEETVEKLKRYYDGYHFSKGMNGVYNPFSLLNVFEDLDFGYYWFQTGTPSYLVKLLKRTHYDPSTLEGLRLPDNDFGNYRADIEKPIPMIYQSGYLTIKDFDSRRKIYTLGFPNEEVRGGFINAIAPSYLNLSRDKSNMAVMSFLDDLYDNNVEGFMTRFKAFVASIDYQLFDDELKERYFQIIFFMVFRLIGSEIESEVHTSNGRMDAVIMTTENIYIFEFKLDKSAQIALDQIDEKHYADRYLADSRAVVKIGANFSSEKRSLEEFIVNSL